MLANSTINTSAGDGSIDLDSTVDGTYDLILTSGAGQIDIDGAIGAGTVLKSLTINAQNSETSSDPFEVCIMKGHYMKLHIKIKIFSLAELQSSS